MKIELYYLHPQTCTWRVTPDEINLPTYTSHNSTDCFLIKGHLFLKRVIISTNCLLEPQYGQLGMATPRNKFVNKYYKEQ